MRQRKTNIVWFHLHEESEKTNEQIQQNKVIDTKNKQVIASREGVGGRKETGERVRGTNSQLQNKWGKSMNEWGIQSITM